jgi:diguanylate cyclase (GGDEF)-like protein
MHDAPIDVCIIEDDAAQRELLLRRLVGEQLSVIEAHDGQEGLEQIRRYHPRVVISDLDMPSLDGFELSRQLRADASIDATYLIVVTSSVSRDMRHQLLHAGADDYLVKPCDFIELLARVRNGLRVRQLQERLRRAALTDGLTGVWNHAHFRSLLDHEFARTRRYGGEVALVMLDLDHFKAVNDTYGHEIGNRVLQATARYLERMVRDTDLVARYGGEEFVIICPQTGADDAAQLALRIRRGFSDEVRVAECPQLRVTATLGVVCSADPEVGSVIDLINRADQALYSGKAQGRDRVVRSEQITQPGEPGIEAGEVDRLRKQVMVLSMQAKELCLQSIWSLVQALEARDPLTACQSRNVTFYVTCLVRAAGWPEALASAAANAAMLHNLGKIGVPDRVLQKPDALTQDEARIMRQVPLITCKILEPLKIFETETLIIRHVRERYDGTGYPAGLMGPTIPLGSRMLAIAETFDAMTSDRAYRRRYSIDAALEEIKLQAGRQFDPQFSDLLMRVVGERREMWQARVDAAVKMAEAQASLADADGAAAAEAE